MENSEKISLENFRNELDEKVLEWGWIYFNNGWVKMPREMMPGYFEVVVEEVNPQAVSFSKNEDGTFTDFFCTCGDKEHEVCRHGAAVLFHYEIEYFKTEVRDWASFEKNSFVKLPRTIPRKG